MKKISLLLTLVIFTTTAHSAELTAESIGGCAPYYQEKLNKIASSNAQSIAVGAGAALVGGGALIIILATQGIGLLVFALLGAGTYGFVGAGAGYLTQAAFDRYNTYSKSLMFIADAAGKSEAELREDYLHAGEWEGKDPSGRWETSIDYKLISALKRKGSQVSYDSVREKILEMNRDLVFCPTKRNGKIKLFNHRQFKRAVLGELTRNTHIIQ